MAAIDDASGGRHKKPRGGVSPSEADLREQLYTSFQDKGVVRSLKVRKGCTML